MCDYNPVFQTTIKDEKASLYNIEPPASVISQIRSLLAEPIELPVKKVYTKSIHEKQVKDIMNDEIGKNAEWKNTILMLSVYPVQKWAAEERKKLKIDLKSISDAIENEASVFGMNAAYSMQVQEGALRATDLALAEIESLVENDAAKMGKDFAVFSAIHDIEARDVSKYKVGEKYDGLLQKACSHSYRKINKYLKPVDDVFQKTDPDMQIAYHNADILVKLGSVLLNDQWRKRSQLDYYDACEQILSCIHAIARYPFEGQTISYILDKTFKGWSTAKTAQALNKSWNYVNTRYEIGVETLSYLIWGYTTQQILGNSGF